MRSCKSSFENRICCAGFTNDAAVARWIGGETCGCFSAFWDMACGFMIFFSFGIFVLLGMTPIAAHRKDYLCALPFRLHDRKARGATAEALRDGRLGSYCSLQRT